MRHFPYQDAWDLDDEAERYARKLQRKRARSRWAVGLLTGIGILTVTSGMILFGAGSRLAKNLDRWETEMWEPAAAQTRAETGVSTATATAAISAPPVEGSPPPDPSAPPAASVAPPAAAPPAAAPSPEPSTKATAQAAEEKPAERKAAPAATPRASKSRPPTKPRAEPDRDLVYGGGVSWPKGTASAAPGDKPAERPAPGGESPAPAPSSSGDNKGVYEDR